MKKILPLLFLASFLISCEKEGEICYQCIDIAGNTLQGYCGESENEVYEQAIGDTVNGVPIRSKAQFLQSCPKQ